MTKDEELQALRAMEMQARMYMRDVVAGKTVDAEPLRQSFRALDKLRGHEVVTPDRACKRCGDYTTTGYCSSRCARGG